jgi:hypothetical protein
MEAMQPTHHHATAQVAGAAGADGPDLAAELRARGLRVTAQREKVLGAVRELGHGTPEQISESVDGVDVATVYRTLELLEELGLDAVRAHDLALADRFRAGLASLGHEPVPSPGSPIVSVPGLGRRQPELSSAGVEVSDRAGNLRAAFHLYNTPADVDRLLDVLSA